MFFSVIIPVYNVENYLRECVDSILSQTFTDFEIILVDDGSKDNSGAICDEYAANDNRIKVIHKENGGQSTARNTGFKEAMGEYVFFIDSDDFVTYNRFFEEVKELSKNNADIIAYRYRKYYSLENTKSIGTPFLKTEYKEIADCLSDMVKTDTFFCSCWTKVIKRSLLTKNNVLFDENLCCEDMDWYYSVLEYAEKIAVLDKECINYRQRENSVTSKFKKKSVTDYIYTIDKWSRKLELIADEKLKYVLLSSLAKLYCNLLIVYSGHRKNLKAEKAKIFSFKYLLKFDLNPRTKQFRKVSDLFGLGLMCKMLDFVKRVR